VVTRNTSGVVECVFGDRIPTRQEGNDLVYCTMVGDDICEYAPPPPIRSTFRPPPLIPPSLQG
jgi:hypothetical protein